MLYKEIIAVCSQIHTKHINTLCGQNVELLNVKLVVHIVKFWDWTAQNTSISYGQFDFMLKYFFLPRSKHTPSPL